MDDSIKVAILEELLRLRRFDRPVTGIYLGHNEYLELHRVCADGDLEQDYYRGRPPKFHGVPVYEVERETHFKIATD